MRPRSFPYFLSSPAAISVMHGQTTFQEFKDDAEDDGFVEQAQRSEFGIVTAIVDDMISKACTPLAVKKCIPNVPDGESDGASGACQYFGSLTRGELGCILGENIAMGSEAEIIAQQCGTKQKEKQQDTEMKKKYQISTGCTVGIVVESRSILSGWVTRFSTLLPA